MRSSRTIGGWVVAGVAVVTLSAAACIDPVDVRLPVGAVALQTEDVVSVKAGWSGFEEPTRSVITDSESWAAAWETLYEHHTPVPERPEVDFGTHVIVLAAMGSRPSTGYTVTIESVHHWAGVLYVSVVERSPGQSCVTGAAITAPVHMVAVPREGATAHFHVKTETYSC